MSTAEPNERGGALVRCRTKPLYSSFGIGGFVGWQSRVRKRVSALGSR
jgi:hypothetical protein